MKDEVTDARLRQFLLGKVTDEQRQQIESLFLTDAELKERVLATEEELIDDYLEGTLTTEDKETFLLNYGQTPEQQRKLRIARSIKEWAVAESSQSAHVKVVAKSSRRRWQIRPALVLSIALAAVIVIVAAIWLWSLYVQRNNRLAVEAELAQLNTPSSLREDPSRILSLELSPVTVRSGEQQAVKPRADTRIIELRLPWVQKERYSTYQSEIHRVGDKESFTIRNLQPETDRGYAIRVRLPVQMLRRAQYQIQLRGVAGDNALTPAEEYTFTVLE